MAIEKKAKRMRKEIANNMLNSWHTSPKCDYEMRVNAEPMLVARKAYNEKYGVKVSFLNFVMKAAAIALHEFPYVNSSYDMERQVHLLHEEINIGFAVAVGDGLVVANVRGADKLDLSALSLETTRLINRISTGQFNMDDISGSTLTINNMGAYKRLIHHNAIINQPELAILSMYNIAEEPVVKDHKVVVQQCMNLMLSADHRAIDGKMACEFLDRVAELLESPEALL